MKGYAVILISLIVLAFNANAYYLGEELSIESNCITPDSISFFLVNNTPETHNYSIEANDAQKSWLNLNSKWIAVEPLAFSLNAGKEKELTLFVVPSCNTESTSYDVSFQVNEDNFSSIEEINVNVFETKKLLMSASSKRSLVEQCGSNIIDVNLKNNSNHEMTVLLSMVPFASGKESFDRTEINLRAFEERTENIPVEIYCNAFLGKTEVVFNGKIKDSLLPASSAEAHFNIQAPKENIVLLEEVAVENDEDGPLIGLFFLSDSNQIPITIIVLVFLAVVVFIFYNQSTNRSRKERTAEKSTKRALNDAFKKTAPARMYLKA